MSNQEKEVLDFLDSLPDHATTTANTGSNTNATPNITNTDSNSENVLDFLDQLEQTSKNINPPKASFKKSASTNTKNKEATPAKDDVKETMAVNTTSEDKNIAQSQVSETKQDAEITAAPIAQENKAGYETPEAELTPLNDPITSFTSWWNKSSQTQFVGNLFNQTKQHIQDTLTKEEHIKEYKNLMENSGKNVVSGIAKNLSKIIVGETSEVLKIHVNHDIINWKFSSLIDDIFYDVLSSQVQDGVKITVDEPTFKETHKSIQPSITNEKEGESTRSANGMGKNLDFQFFNGKITDGEKLCMANLEDAIKSYESLQHKKQASKEANKTKDGNDEEHEKDDEEKEEEEDDDDDDDSEDEQEGEVSDVFISILPVAVPETATATEESDLLIVDSNQAGNFSLTFILKDITNDVTILVRSQGFPIQWARWIMKDEFLENIEPGEWVRDWIENGIKLSIQTLAQNYVLKRINVI
ncbi:hypothetical protein ACO0RG_001412 [Hanseniaspora osmophila]